MNKFQKRILECAQAGGIDLTLFFGQVNRLGRDLENAAEEIEKTTKTVFGEFLKGFGNREPL
jgi:hypothetical protein